MTAWRITFALFGSLVALGGPLAGAPTASAGAVTPGECAGLRALNAELERLEGAPTALTSAADMPATVDPTPPAGGSTPGGKSSPSVPAHCRVTGYVANQVKFELRLPRPEAWNGRFWFGGCGGLCGAVSGSACNPGLTRGYAAITTNAGHDGGGGLWAMENPVLKRDWGHRAVHVVTLAGKAITRAYYGRGIQRSYFSGCSNGGRQGLMEAVRYPEDFDAITIGDPIIDVQGLGAILFPWMHQANKDAEGRIIIPHTKLPALYEAALGSCDAVDGLRDRLIDDPRRCRFDPAVVKCPAGEDRVDCLTRRQVRAARTLYSPPTDSRGRQLFDAGVPVGGELDWATWITGTATTPPLVEFFDNSYLKYVAMEPFPGVDWDPLTFDFDRDVRRLEALRPVFDATNPDLRRFKARGGKILMWIGLADSGSSPVANLNHYEKVVRRMGGLRRTQSFFRVFALPGKFHCASGGPGLNDFDAVAPLERWVEEGVAPEKVIAGHRNADGVTDRTRPVFPYPTVARYDGSGSIDDAENFVPFDPPQGASRTSTKSRAGRQARAHSFVRR